MFVTESDHCQLFPVPLSFWISVHHIWNTESKSHLELDSVSISAMAEAANETEPRHNQETYFAHVSYTVTVTLPDCHSVTLSIFVEIYGCPINQRIV
jgi:hypothetical protein